LQQENPRGAADDQRAPVRPSQGWGPEGRPREGLGNEAFWARVNHGWNLWGRGEFEGEGIRAREEDWTTFAPELQAHP
jgi:Putative zinc ribbon domain